MWKLLASVLAVLAVLVVAECSWVLYNENPPLKSQYKCVGRVIRGSRACSGAAISPFHVLTAKHCLNHHTHNHTTPIFFLLDGVRYSNVNVSAHPTADLALVRFESTAFEHVCKICSKDDGRQDLTGKQFCGIGFGAGSYNISKGWNSDYAKRMFCNRFDARVEVGAGVGEGVGAGVVWEYSLSHVDSVEYEGIHGPGDSGGPMMIDVGASGECIVGVMSYARGKGIYMGQRAGGPLVHQ